MASVVETGIVGLVDSAVAVVIRAAHGDLGVGVVIDGQAAVGSPDTALDDDGNGTEHDAGIDDIGLETGVLVLEGAVHGVVLDEVHALDGILAGLLAGQGDDIGLVAVGHGLDRADRAGVVGAVVVELVHQVEGHAVAAELPDAGTGTVDLVRGVLQVAAVGVGGDTVVVAASEDELLVLAGLEQGAEILDSLIHAGGSGLVEAELAGVDDGFAGRDALLVVTIGVGGVHIGEFLGDGLVAGQTCVLPVLAHGSGPEGDAGLETEGGPLGGAVVAGAAGVRQEIGRLVQFGEDEVPGLLLGAAGDVQFRALAAVVLVVQRFGHDRNAAIDADGSEIVVGPDELGFAQERVVGLLGDDVVLLGLADGLDEEVDVADVGVVPVAVHAAGIAAATGGLIGVGSVLLAFRESAHRNGLVQRRHQTVQTGLGGGEVRRGHLGQVAFEVVEDLVAGGQAEDDRSAENIGKYLFHMLHFVRS